MTERKHIPSQDLGLELGLLFARHLVGTEDLHYGLWAPGLPVKLANMPRAQAAHTQLVIDNIPQDVRRILDVGCGAGVIGEQLVQRGYTVDCVGPEGRLLARARDRLDGRASVHAARFQDFRTDDKFDLILFSESFQYVPLEDALPRCESMLRPGGYILICDFFKQPGRHGAPIGGGHRLQVFRDLVQSRGLNVVTDLDITAQTAPNADLADDFLREVGKPAYELVDAFARESWPLATRVSRWFMRKRLRKLEDKYFSGRRNAAVFAEFKSYRLVLLQRPVAAHAAAKG